MFGFFRYMTVVSHNPHRHLQVCRSYRCWGSFRHRTDLCRTVLLICTGRRTRSHELCILHVIQTLNNTQVVINAIGSITFKYICWQTPARTIWTAFVNLSFFGYSNFYAAVTATLRGFEQSFKRWPRSPHWKHTAIDRGLKYVRFKLFNLFAVEGFTPRFCPLKFMNAFFSDWCTDDRVELSRIITSCDFLYNCNAAFSFPNSFWNFKPCLATLD